MTGQPARPQPPPEVSPTQGSQTRPVLGAGNQMVSVAITLLCHFKRRAAMDGPVRSQQPSCVLVRLRDKSRGESQLGQDLHRHPHTSLSYACREITAVRRCL